MISVEIIIREMKEGEKEGEKKKKERSLSSQRESSDRKKIRTIPLNSLQNIIILSLVDSFFYRSFFIRTNDRFFFSFFFLREHSLFTRLGEDVKSCTNNYLSLKFFANFTLFRPLYFIVTLWRNNL